MKEPRTDSPWEPDPAMLDGYTQDGLRIIARRALAKMWTSGKVEIIKETLDRLFERLDEYDEEERRK